ncbi:MAG: potassium channel family protein [Candidatus Sericytochromatia bacterium]
MYIVIAGGGLMGLSLAEQLVAHKHDVLVIDPDPSVCEYAQAEIGTMVHCGNATSTKALEAVGLRRAQIVVAMMRNDADNLAFILLAKSYGVERRLVRMREKPFEQAYLLAGATAICSSVDPLIDQMIVNIEYPEIKALMRIGKRDIDVFEVTVPKDAQVAGMTVEAIAQTMALPPTCNFVAVENAQGTMEIARGHTVVPGGTNVILLAKEVDLELVIRLLTQSRAGATTR